MKTLVRTERLNAGARSFLRGISIILILSVFVGCATTAPKVKTFDEAEELANSIFWAENDRIINEIVAKFPGEVMAVWGTADGEFDDLLASNYEVKIAQHGLLIATRTRMRFINKEFDFQLSGMVRDNDIKSYGQMMGVSNIILIETRNSGDTRDISVLDIERGIILYSAHFDKDLTLENILKENNIPFPTGENANTNMGTSDTNLPFYLKEPAAKIEIDFGSPGLGILLYYGFRPSREEFSLVESGKYFHDYIDPSETLLAQSYRLLENNTDLDGRVKAFMRTNNLTFCNALYLNNQGGFTYIVNYSFDNYKTFGLVTMDSYGYKPSP